MVLRLILTRFCRLESESTSRSQKRCRYAYQDEFRFVWSPIVRVDRLGHVGLSTGSLEGIAPTDGPVLARKSRQRGNCADARLAVTKLRLDEPGMRVGKRRK